MPNINSDYLGMPDLDLSTETSPVIRPSPRYPTFLPGLELGLRIIPVSTITARTIELLDPSDTESELSSFSESSSVATSASNTAPPSPLPESELPNSRNWVRRGGVTSEIFEGHLLSPIFEQDGASLLLIQSPSPNTEEENGPTPEPMERAPTPLPFP